MIRKQHQKYVWIEMGARPVGGTLMRGHFVRVNDEEALCGWRWLHGNTDVYRSVCQFKKDNWNDGYTCDFFLEIDGPDLPASRAAILVACRHLIQRIGVQPESFDIVFNAHNGLSLVVPLVVFGQPAQDGLVAIWEQLARFLRRQGVPHISVNAYQPEHMRRLVNSCNSRTGLYVVPLEFQELADLDVDYITELARQTREHDSMALPTESDKAMGWLHRAMEWAQGNAERVRQQATLSGRATGPVGSTPSRRERPRGTNKQARKSKHEGARQLLLFEDGLQR